MTAIDRGVPDRVPWGLWGQFPALPFLKYYSWEKSNRDGEETAKAHIALLNELDYKMDLLKVTYFFRFMACLWGTKYRFTDNQEATEQLDVPVKRSEDWGKLWVLDPRKELREHVRTIAILSREIGRRMPFIFSLPSPLVVAINQVATPQQVYADMKSNPDALKQGLETISQTCIEFGRACMDEGATGLFYGLAGGGNIWSKITRDQLENYGLHYDRKVLDTLKDAPIRFLHVCSHKGDDPQNHGGLMESGWFKQYPVNAINWSDATFTPLPIAKKVYGDAFCIVGGVDHEITMRTGTPAQVENEVKSAIQSAGKEGFMIGPGCTLVQDTPLENFNAVGKAVERYGRVAG
jgi:uroporphyrinogen decarboxylase